MLLLAAVLMGSACGDDNAVTTAGPDTESTTGTDSTPSTVTITTLDTTTEGSSTSVVDSTETASSTGADSTTTGDTSTGDDSTSGGVVENPGQTVNQLVSAGERSSSRSYTLVYTFGQPSQLQSTHNSPNYRIQGGLIGANGSPP